MSIQAMAWAIEQQEVRESGSRHVLLCLCNYADQAGDAVFPSVERLARDTGMDRRSVQRQLRKLERAIVIVKSNPSIVAVHIKRLDRRPQCYRVNMTGRHNATPLLVRGGTSAETGRHLEHKRGGTMPPDPSSDPSINRKRVLQTVLETESQNRAELERQLKTLAKRKKV